MKNIFLIITLLSVNLISCQVYPLNTSPSEIPNNANIKDTNNELDKYVGLWKGDWNGKTVYLELKKIKIYSSTPGDTHPYYIDKILGERKIIAANGTIEIDRISNFNNGHPEFIGIYNSLRNIGKYALTFYPKDMCGKRAKLEITNFTNTQMTLHFEYEPSIYNSNCVHNAYVQQHGDFPINFPKDITLIKQ